MIRVMERSGAGTASTAARTLDAIGRLSGLRTLAGSLRRRLQHRRTLKALTQLDDRLLRDIGVSRADIEATAAFCCDATVEETPSVWQRLGVWLGRERRRRRTVRELSAMTDEILTDIGIERAEIPAVAAALVSDRPAADATGELPAPAPQSAEVFAFIEARRRVQRIANCNVSRPAA